RVEAGHRIGKSLTDCGEERQQFCGNIRSFCQTPCFSQIGSKQSKNQIRDIQNYQAFDFFLTHKSRSCFFCRTFAGMEATNCFSLFSCLSTLGFFCFCSRDAEYSLNAAVMASPSLALKNTRYRGGAWDGSFVMA